MNRQQLVKAITRHVEDPQETTDADVRLVWELIWALTWSPEINELARRLMETMVMVNKLERMSEGAGVERLRCQVT